MSNEGTGPTPGQIALGELKDASVKELWREEGERFAQTAEPFVREVLGTVWEGGQPRNYPDTDFIAQNWDGASRSAVTTSSPENVLAFYGGRGGLEKVKITYPGTQLEVFLSGRALEDFALRHQQFKPN